MFKKVKMGTSRVGKESSALSTFGEKFVALPREKVSEPTRSPFVVWSTKHKMIVDTSPDMESARKIANSYNKQIKSK